MTLKTRLNMRAGFELYISNVGLLRNWKLTKVVPMANITGKIAPMITPAKK